MSAQGQPVTIPNFQNVSLANTKSGVLQLRPASKTIAGTVGTDTTSKTIPGAVKKIIPQNKNIVAKVILGKCLV